MAQKVYTIERTLKEVKVLRVVAKGIFIFGLLMFPIGGVVGLIWEPLGNFVVCLVLPIWGVAWLVKYYAKLLYWWHNS